MRGVGERSRDVLIRSETGFPGTTITVWGQRRRHRGPRGESSREEGASSLRVRLPGSSPLGPCRGLEETEEEERRGRREKMEIKRRSKSQENRDGDRSKRGENTGRVKTKGREGESEENEERCGKSKK